MGEHQPDCMDSATSSIVELNIGGATFATSLTTLRADADSMLAALFSGDYQLDTDSAGRAFIDRDGRYFYYILNYLRGVRQSAPGDPQVLEAVLEEARYFGLERLSMQLQAHSPTSIVESTADRLARISKEHQIDSVQTGGEQLATDTALPVVLDWLDRAAARGVRLVAFESGLCNRRGFGSTAMQGGKYQSSVSTSGREYRQVAVLFDGKLAGFGWQTPDAEFTAGPPEGCGSPKLSSRARDCETFVSQAEFTALADVLSASAQVATFGWALIQQGFACSVTATSDEVQAGDHQLSLEINLWEPAQGTETFEKMHSVIPIVPLLNDR